MPNHDPLSKNNYQNGFAMIEVLVTAVILAIGISGLGVLLLRAIQGTQDSAQQSQAIWMVQDYVGRIRANPEGARQSLYELTTYPDCTVKPTMCADHIFEGTEVDGNVCPPTAMAEYDTWITVCGLEDSIYDSPSDFIVNSQLGSFCTLNHATRSSNPRTGALDCVQYNVSLTWDIQVNQNASNTTKTNSYSIIVEVN